MKEIMLFERGLKVLVNRIGLQEGKEYQLINGRIWLSLAGINKLLKMRVFKMEVL